MLLCHQHERTPNVENFHLTFLKFLVLCRIFSYSKSKNSWPKSWVFIQKASLLKNFSFKNSKKHILGDFDFQNYEHIIIEKFQFQKITNFQIFGNIFTYYLAIKKMLSDKILLINFLLIFFFMESLRFRKFKIS